VRIACSSNTGSRNNRDCHGNEICLELSLSLCIGRSISRRCSSLAVALLWASTQGAEAAPIPFGSYQQSCQNIRASSGILRANCQTRRGDYFRARLENYVACRGDIANAEGRLVCREIPGDIILFENSLFRGRWLSITADTNLPRWLNDRTSSIRVRRGVWQVCSDRDYRGRCEIIRGDVRDLKSLRLNDRISSVRRILPRPEGSYLQSCTAIRFDGRFLSADCRDRRGRVSSSQLDVRSCPPGSDIFVRRGELSCGDRRGNDDRDDYNDNDSGYDDSRVPRGSYLRTCRYPRWTEARFAPNARTAMATGVAAHLKSATAAETSATMTEN
jgi:hypothetical protein